MKSLQMSTEVKHRQKSAKNGEGSERSQNGLRNARRAVHAAEKTRAEDVRDLMLRSRTPKLCDFAKDCRTLHEAEKQMPTMAQNTFENSHALNLHVWLHSYRSILRYHYTKKYTNLFAFGKCNESYMYHFSNLSMIRILRRQKETEGKASYDTLFHRNLSLQQSTPAYSVAARKDCSRAGLSNFGTS
jgi:hypothetical protein